METNNTESELKALRELVEQLENPVETERKQRVLRRVFIGVGYVGLIIGFLLAWHGIGHVIFASIIIGFAGAAVGIGTFLGWSIKQWPITIRYVDLDRIKRRLNELEI